MPVPTKGGEETVKEDDQGQALLGDWFIGRRLGAGRSEQAHRNVLQTSSETGLTFGLHGRRPGSWNSRD